MLLDLFILNNIHIESKIKDIIILLNNIDSNTNYNNLLKYDEKQLKKFIKLNLKNLLKDIQ